MLPVSMSSLDKEQNNDKHLESNPFATHHIWVKLSGYPFSRDLAGKTMTYLLSQNHSFTKETICHSYPNCDSKRLKKKMQMYFHV